MLVEPARILADSGPVCVESGSRRAIFGRFRADFGRNWANSRFFQAWILTSACATCIVLGVLGHLGFSGGLAVLVALKMGPKGGRLAS